MKKMKKTDKNQEELSDLEQPLTTIHFYRASCEFWGESVQFPYCLFGEAFPKLPSDSLGTWNTTWLFCFWCCWWGESCATRNAKDHVNDGINRLSTGAVVQDFWIINSLFVTSTPSPQLFQERELEMDRASTGRGGFPPHILVETGRFVPTKM